MKKKENEETTRAEWRVRDTARLIGRIYNYHTSPVVETIPRFSRLGNVILESDLLLITYTERLQSVLELFQDL